MITIIQPIPRKIDTGQGEIFSRLEAGGHIGLREIVQAFDPEKGLFLADRFIKGTCPRCKTPDQYGDNCEACGATYSPSDLIDPVSALSGATPEDRASTHLFFHLAHFRDLLTAWTQGNIYSRRSETNSGSG